MSDIDPTDPALEWAHVTDGVVDVGPGPLPGAWENVSYPAGLPAAELAALGWLPVDRDDVADVDPRFDLLGDEVLAVAADRVRVGRPVRHRPIADVRNAVAALVQAQADQRLAATQADVDVALEAGDPVPDVVRSARADVRAACAAALDAVASADADTLRGIAANPLGKV